MTILDTSPTALVLVDETGRPRFSNNKAGEVFGIDGDLDASTVPLWRITTPDAEELARAKPWFAELVEAAPFQDELYVLVSPDGHTRFLSVSARPTGDAGGARGLVLAFEDVPGWVGA